MSFQFGAASNRNKREAHPDLITVLEWGIRRTVTDFTIYDGGRTLQTQQGHVDSGASMTLNSRHRFDEHRIFYAVDLAPWINGTIDWSPEKYIPIFNAIFEGAAHYGIPLDWGGWWKSFKGDFNHIALDRKHYPKDFNVSTYQSRLDAGYKLITNPETGKYVRTEYYERKAA